MSESLARELFTSLEERVMQVLASHLDGIKKSMEDQAEELREIRRGAVDIVDQQDSINKRLGWLQSDCDGRGFGRLVDKEPVGPET